MNCWRLRQAESDFSPAADAAWSFAVDLGASRHAELLLLPVAMPFPSVAPQPAKRDHERAIATAERLVADRIGAAKSRGLIAEGMVATGDAAHLITAIARNEHVDLVIIGGHPPVGTGDILIGSVAERVVPSAPCAVRVGELHHEYVRRAA